MVPVQGDRVSAAELRRQPGLADLHDALAAIDGGDDLVMKPIEGFEKGTVAAIAQADPDQVAGIAGPRDQKDEVFILAYDHAPLGEGVIPDGQIVGFVKSGIGDMHAIMAPVAQVRGKRLGQLIVDQQFHVLLRTMWSVWRAA